MRVLTNPLLVTLLLFAPMFAGCTFNPTLNLGYNEGITVSPTSPTDVDFSPFRDRRNPTVEARREVPKREASAAFVDPRIERARGVEEARRQRGIPFANAE